MINLTDTMAGLFADEERFERFMRATKNMACVGCGEVGVYEFRILDSDRGVVQCPRCAHVNDLKRMMKTWVTEDERG